MGAGSGQSRLFCCSAIDLSFPQKRESIYQSDLYGSLMQGLWIPTFAGMTSKTKLPPSLYLTASSGPLTRPGS